MPHLSELSPEVQDERLSKVLTLPGLPDMEQAVVQGQFDIEKFLEVRASPQGQAFRQWVANASAQDISELRDQWGSVRSSLGSWMNAQPGKTLRFLASTGIGAIPGVGLGGAALGVLDRFLLTRLFPASTAVTFLRHSYGSIFSRPKQDAFTSI